MRLAEGIVGQACTQGRSHRKAEVAALIDSLNQREVTSQALRSQILQPLAAALEAKRSVQSQATAATQVQFFTRLRGDN